MVLYSILNKKAKMNDLQSIQFMTMVFLFTSVVGFYFIVILGMKDLEVKRGLFNWKKSHKLYCNKWYFNKGKRNEPNRKK